MPQTPPVTCRSSGQCGMILGDSLEIAVHFPAVDRAGMLGKDNEITAHTWGLREKCQSTQQEEAWALPPPWPSGGAF